MTKQHTTCPTCKGEGIKRAWIYGLAHRDGPCQDCEGTGNTNKEGPDLALILNHHTGRAHTN